MSSREDTEKTAVCRVRRESPSYGHLELGLESLQLPAGWLQPRGLGPSAARHSAPADEHGTPRSTPEGQISLTHRLRTKNDPHCPDRTPVIILRASSWCGVPGNPETPLNTGSGEPGQEGDRRAGVRPSEGTTSPLLGQVMNQPDTRGRSPNRPITTAPRP